jgi:ABC-2 type transport system ATP-binding protein
MKFAVEIENLTKDYQTGFWRKKNVRALEDLTLKVKPEQIFGFLGGNGAGKTTTIKILMGLLFPSGGTAKIFDKEITDVDMHQMIGYCPENPYFYDYLTARELMNYFGEIFGMDKSARKQRTEELLSSVGLDEKSWDRQLRKFSKGMLQRVGLAQSLINDPKIVFLDEPMSGLDPIGRREIRELIANLRTQGKTVFMSTHILSDIEALCDEVAILRRGRLAATGNLQDLLTTAGDRQGFEITVTNVNSEQLRSRFADTPGISVDQHAGGSIIHCEDDEGVESVISIARSCGGKLVSVSQVKQSLEDLFVRDNS